MAKYDYRCEQSGRTVEVSHSMDQVINTWGELCALAGIEAGETPAESPVHKVISGGFITTGARSQASSHSCTAPACCSGGMCGLDT